VQVRYTYLIDRLLACGKHVLCVGDTGTGKTLNVANKLMNEMPPEVGLRPGGCRLECFGRHVWHGARRGVGLQVWSHRDRGAHTGTLFTEAKRT
jgi:hypothetical protein